ncbi:MaoC/PaaZ C-terminal domain-containing protein [Streptomyces sp. NBC_00151]|uniref:MaoC/PaaZ C-terminal domain-containing protein n=1 Tax=Streptomyces sp. NBC_00151 TaxID=2975669 RepID=UPI002DD90CC1|nr:MaoC/PaaZ C-terminal domain-containing protein [Streptomyces sp. NBC_00151]WRZ40186.1 MaoC/PaaZ C-terminal domain-containing protein [Streptomyces sp. NBC_00151]
MRVQPPVRPEPGTRTLAAPPSLVPLLARGTLLSPFKRPRPDAPVPATRFVLPGVRVDLAHLAAYERVCGFPTGADALPVTYPHVLAFPLAMRILAGRAFPLPLLGLVHTSIEITGRQECAASAEYELAVLVEKLAPHRRGTEATVLTEARVHGELVWESRSTYLARHRPRNPDKSPAQDHAHDRDRDRGRGLDRELNRYRDRSGDLDLDRSGDRDLDRDQDGGGGGGGDRDRSGGGERDRGGDLDRDRDRKQGGERERGACLGRRQGSEPLPALAEWRLAPDVGRRYGAVSGDRNPIHLHPLTARLFGFPRAIAHGMWTVARCLAEYGPGQPAQVRAEFRAPVLLPGAVTYAARGTSFELRSGERLHLTGDVRPPRA